MNSRPRLVVRYFGRGVRDEWPRLVRVLRASADRHCAAWERDIASFTPAPRSSPLGLQGNVANTQKLEAWCQAVWTAPDGERLLLLDADTVILRSLDSIWEHAFDVAYTVKPHRSRFPLNGGVIFLRVSPVVRAFMTAWQDQNRRYLEGDRVSLKEYELERHLYGGINQTALGILLRRNELTDLRLLPLPCAEWNVEDEHWATYDASRARILHVKSELQRAVFNRCRVSPELRSLVALWRSLEADAMRKVEVPA